jgi:hypothetical protein
MRRLVRTGYRYSPAYRYVVPGTRLDEWEGLDMAAERFLDSLRSLGMTKTLRSLGMTSSAARPRYSPLYFSTSAGSRFGGPA